MADIANAADTVRPLKTRARKAASHLKAVTTETAAEANEDAQGLIDSLRHEIGALAAEVEHYAEERYDQARAAAGAVADAGAIVAARAGRQTVAAANAIRRDPLPALVAVGILSLLLALVLGATQRR